MEAADILRFEAAAGRVLEENGYARSGQQADIQLAQSVARIKQQFTAQAVAKGYNLPSNWAQEDSGAMPPESKQACLSI